MREIAGRVIGRLQHGAVVGAYLAWSDHTRWSLWSRKIVGRMLSRWQMKEVAGCFEAWCEDVRLSHMRVHTAICRSVAVVTSDRTGHARADVVTQYPVGRVVEILETRLVGGRLRALTTDGWAWYVLENGTVQLEELSLDDLDRVRSEQVLRKAAARITHAKTSSAFEAWSEYASTLIRMRYVTTRVIGRMQHGMLGGAFSGWSEYVSWSVRSKGILDRMLLKLMCASKVVAFDAWVALVTLNERERHKTSTQNVATLCERVEELRATVAVLQ